MEREWKLGKDVYPEDSMLDGFTFKSVIDAVHCNCEHITPQAVRDTAREILSERLQDFEYLLENNITEIMLAAAENR